MKTILLIITFIFSACSSNRVQETAPTFQKEKVCSPEALDYLERDQRKSSGPRKYTDDEIYNKMLILQPEISTCYEEEMEKSGKYDSFNLCLVVGYDEKGMMDFFNFSTNELTLSKEFIICLEKLKNRKEIKGFKSLSIVQPFKLIPRRN